MGPLRFIHIYAELTEEDRLMICSFSLLLSEPFFVKGPAFLHVSFIGALLTW